MADPYVLEDGARIAVIGGGPSGSFFSIFALRMAKMAGKRISLTIYEPKDFTKDGPAGCNRCGGIISELLVQTLAVEGITLPESVVQRGIDSYNLHTDHGSVFIPTPAHEKTIATVYRGGGPKGGTGIKKESFDNFLLSLAVSEGAEHKQVKIERIEYKQRRPVLYAGGLSIDEPDLVAGAIGVKSGTSRLFEDMGFGYKAPETVTAAITEIETDSRTIEERFGNSVHLFLLPMREMKFAAMIPKGTLCNALPAREKPESGQHECIHLAQRCAEGLTRIIALYDWVPMSAEDECEGSGSPVYRQGSPVRGRRFVPSL